MDDRIRSLAHDARDEVERGLDVERELVDTFARGEVRTASFAELRGFRRRAAPLAAAAAVVITVGVGGLWLTRNNGDSTVLTADAPLTAPVPETTTVESQTSGTEPSATTSVSSSSTTTVAPSSTTIGPRVATPEHMDAFVTVTGDNSTIIDVRDADGVISSQDLGCPPDRVCAIESAQVIGDTIWTTITEREGGADDTVTGTRVMSVAQATDDVTEHLAIEGATIARSAGRGADGVVYAQLDEALGPGSSFVAIQNGETRELGPGVSSFRLSDDGRLLAVSFAEPSAGVQARLEFTDLLDGRSNKIQTSYINAGPAAWSPDGRHLVLAYNWEDGTAWVIDPWSDSAEPIQGTERFLDGACFIDNNVMAHRTWDVGYGQGDAQPGAIRLTSIDTGNTVADLAVDLFGDNQLACHPDGSVSFLRRPVTDVEIAPDLTQLEPVYDAPVELVHVDPTGAITVRATGDLRLF